MRVCSSSLQLAGKKRRCIPYRRTTDLWHVSGVKLLLKLAELEEMRSRGTCYIGAFLKKSAGTAEGETMDTRLEAGRSGPPDAMEVSFFLSPAEPLRCSCRTSPSLDSCRGRRRSSGGLSCRSCACSLRREGRHTRRASGRGGGPGCRRRAC